MNYNYILWDWNGTLIDDVQTAVNCVNDMLKDFGLPQTNLCEYYEMFEYPITKYYAKLVDLEKHSFSEITKLFQQSYRKRVLQASLAKNAVITLEFFKQNGVSQSIVSSFEQNRLTEDVGRFGINKYFDEISGAADILVGSKVSRAVEIAKNKDKVVFVGDSLSDYNAAQSIGCDCILVSYGHEAKEKLLATGCPVIDDLIDLKNYF